MHSDKIQNWILWRDKLFCQVWNFPDFSLTAGHPVFFSFKRPSCQYVSSDSDKGPALYRWQAISTWTNPSPPIEAEWGIYASLNCVINGSDNGLSPVRRQAIIWTNAGILFIGPSGTNFSEISIEMQTFLFKKMCLNVSSAKWRPFCLGLNVLTGLIVFKQVTLTAFYLISLITIFIFRHQHNLSMDYF